MYCHVVRSIGSIVEVSIRISGKRMAQVVQSSDLGGSSTEGSAAVWILLVNQGEKPYYWNRLTDKTSWGPMSTTWAGRKDDYGIYYFWKIGSLESFWFWQLPPLATIPSSGISRTTRSGGQSSSVVLDFSNNLWCRIGTPVSIVCLRSNVRFHNQVGVVVSTSADRSIVRLSDALCSDVVLSLKADNIRPLFRGSLVEYSGVGLPVRTGSVVEYIADTSSELLRYLVVFSDNSKQVVDAKLLKPRSRLYDLGEKLSCHIAQPRRLQWRGEHCCTFVDDNGDHRKYMLHLPYRVGSRDAESFSQWPLLVYMHGSGDRSFFGFTKDSLASVGMQFASRNFVVVSPQCEWKWRDVPGDWVIELIEAF